MAVGTRSTRIAWAVWVVLSLVAAWALADRMTNPEADREVFLPGKTTHGHYQIELACDACHTEDFSAPEDFQDACLSCHEQELEQADDSHPTSKFTDPRNADRVAQLDARQCITCHAEHEPERTGTMGLSLPGDYCYHCHQEVGEERDSHRGLAFDSCADAGCHNFHDNRALYEDYLVRHGREPWLLAAPLVPVLSAPEQENGEALVRPDAPAKYLALEHVEAWRASAHPAAGVNCTSCHTAEGGDWTSDVPVSTCQGCHSPQTEGWLAGRHGMRVAQGLPAMKVEDARLAMKTDAVHRELSCASCHGPHGTERERAGLEACQGCHDDQHTRAYDGSRHHEMLELARAGRIAREGGVSCATCHLPRREDDNGRVYVEHNQNDNLRPNEKMVRNACGNCHGLPFALDALADRSLIERNFSGRPQSHVAGVDWALARE